MRNFWRNSRSLLVGVFLFTFSMVFPMNVKAWHGSLTTGADCEKAWANLSVTPDSQVVYARINGQSTRHLEVLWGNSTSVNFLGQILWETTESWSDTKTANKPACPTPSLTPTPIPTVTLTPTPTPIPTVTLTPTPIPTVTLTPTPIPTVTLTPTPTGVLGQSLISITKSNNKSGGAGVNDYVNYTLRVTNGGDTNFSEVVVTDVMPGGFLFYWGSTKLNGASFANPGYNDGRLTWVLDYLGHGQTATLEYQVQISGDIDPAVYTNIATCDATVENRDDTLGCNVVRSDVPVGSNLAFSANVGGSVLGTSTSVLPATGVLDRSFGLYSYFTMLSFGMLIKLLALVMEKEDKYGFIS